MEGNLAELQGKFRPSRKRMRRQRSRSGRPENGTGRFINPTDLRDRKPWMIGRALITAENCRGSLLTPSCFLQTGDLPIYFKQERVPAGGIREWPAEGENPGERSSRYAKRAFTEQGL
jgi:hypothetical protein